MLFLLCFAQITCGEDFFERSPFYNGEVFFDLETQEYSAGEILRVNITIVNMEDFPLLDSYLVIDIVSGGKDHIYPSQISDIDNVSTKR